MNSRINKLAFLGILTLTTALTLSSKAEAGVCPTGVYYNNVLVQFKKDNWGPKYPSRLVITNPKDQKDFLLIGFDRLALDGYTSGGGFSQSLDDIMLARIKKVRTAGWQICDAETTSLGRLQLAYILENGQLNKEYSNRDTELSPSRKTNVKAPTKK